MPKNTKNKAKGRRVRSFKVHKDSNGKPFLHFGGKYFTNELGINCGDRLELIPDGDGFKLRKFSPIELAEYETARRTKDIKAMLKKVFPIRSKETRNVFDMMVAENRATYSVGDEIAKRTQRYLQD